MTDAAQTFLDAMSRRYACKLFEPARPLSREETDFILECARLSPSSFGLEPWQFFAVTGRDAIAALKDACFGQDAVGTAALAVVIACRRAAAFDPSGAFVASRGSRFPGGLRAFVDDYRGYYEYLASNGLLDSWARAQCYIPCANMMTGAAAAGIDSCAIEGFDGARVLAAIGADTALWQTGIVTVFGHAARDDSREKIRESALEIVTHV